MNELDGIPLPPLQVAELDQDKLSELFADIDALGEGLDVLVKRAAGHIDGDERVSLATAKQLLEQRSIQGVQLRYRFRGADWWDTLICTESGVRLVRMQQGPMPAEAMQ